MNTRIMTIVTMLCLTLTSCEIVGGIFKAGAWTGGILVIGIIILVLFILFKAFGKKE